MLNVNGENVACSDVVGLVSVYEGTISENVNIVAKPASSIKIELVLVE